MNTSAKNVIHITDTHLYDNAQGRLLNMNTRLSFAAVLAQIRNQHKKIDAVLATGDIAQDASAGAYHHFLDKVRTLDAPCYWLPGNHDRRAVMQQIKDVHSVWPWRLRLGDWQIILLDSSVDGQVSGRVGEQQLAMLEHFLAEAAADTDGPAHALVCLHHNPAPGNAAWMEGIGLRNAEELLAVLRRHANVRAVLHGHIHQRLDFQHHGIRILCTPSTCFQFKPRVMDFTLDQLGPAYRWLQLFDDGRLETGVECASDFVFSLDHNAGGY